MKKFNQPFQRKSKLDINTRGKDYIKNILLEEESLKCLFLDEQTFQTITLLFYKSELFNYKVFDSLNISTFDQIECQAKTAVLILRPNDDNILQITQSLSRVSFNSVRICKRIILIIFFILFFFRKFFNF